MVTVLPLVARALIALILIAAGLAKLAARESFQKSLRGFSLLPKGAHGVLLWSLPAVEVASGATLAVGLWPTITSTISMALFSLFLVLTTAELVIGSSALKSCGCFGRQTLLSPAVPIRNGALILLALAVARPDWSPWAIGGSLMTITLLEIYQRSTRSGEVATATLAR